MTSISFNRLSKHFHRRMILDGINLALTPGQCILLSGNNGAGKSTLLRIMAGLEKPDRAIINIDHTPGNWKQSRKLLQRHVVYLHQQPYMFDGDVCHNLAYALSRKLPRAERETQVEQALAWAGLEAIAGNPARTLSGGERQRVAIARAWLRQPAVMLLDEPTANMDNEARLRTVQLLTSLKQQGIALMIASHDPLHFYALSDAWLGLQDGKLETQHLDDADTSKVTPIYHLQQAHS